MFPVPIILSVPGSRRVVNWRRGWSKGFGVGSLWGGQEA